MAKLIPRKLLTIAKSGTLICVGIAETACNLPLPPSGPRMRPGTGGTPGLEIPEGETSSGGQEASSTGGQPGGASSGGDATADGSAGDGGGF